MNQIIYQTACKTNIHKIDSSDGDKMYKTNEGL